MRTKHLVAILVLLALVLPASPVHAGGVVSVCDETHLLAALAGGGTVTFACSGTITLTAGITIAADTIIDGSGQAVTISGNRILRVFVVNSGARLNLNRLAIVDGYAAYRGGGIFMQRGTLTVSNSTFSGNAAGTATSNWGGGGAIYNNEGTVTVSNSTFSGNAAGTATSNWGLGGGIYNERGTLTVSSSTFSANSAMDGGGIDSSGTLIVSNSAFSSNSAFWGGGGIYCSGTVTVSNSTFSGNRGGDHGGGIASFDTLTLTNTTFSGNSANTGGAISSAGPGPLTMSNSIVANSPAGGNCSGTINDSGGNLSYPDTTCPGINADPMLGPLQNNLGPTETMQLGPGSAAIDAGNDAICAASPVNGLDQRGIARPWGAHCDIGAVEQLPIKKLWLPAARAR